LLYCTGCFSRRKPGEKGRNHALRAPAAKAAGTAFNKKNSDCNLTTGVLSKIAPNSYLAGSFTNNSNIHHLKSLKSILLSHVIYSQRKILRPQGV
jgi:hypothetical protein